jgi:hypothetical protein
MAYGDLPDFDGLLRHFGVPRQAFVDNCYAVAHSIAAEFPHLRARVVEGIWTGEVAPGSHFRWLVDDGLVPGGVAHWWLETPDGRVIDATRWVFEGREPYVFHGPPDFYAPGRPPGRAPAA